MNTLSSRQLEVNFTVLAPMDEEDESDDLFAQTLQYITYGKVWRDKVFAETEYSQLLRYLKSLPRARIEDCKRNARLVNYCCNVFQQFDTIEFNIKSCKNIPIQRLSVYQLYECRKMSFCYKLESTPQPKPTKTQVLEDAREPLYTEAEFEAWIKHVKDSELYRRVSGNGREVTKLLSRTQHRLAHDVY